MTRRFGGKPSLFVAIELGDGGGTASIQSLGVDYVMPTDIGELDSVILELSRDTKYGGDKPSVQLLRPSAQLSGHLSQSHDRPYP